MRHLAEQIGRVDHGVGGCVQTTLARVRVVWAQLAFGRSLAFGILEFGRIMCCLYAVHGTWYIRSISCLSRERVRPNVELYEVYVRCKNTIWRCATCQPPWRLAHSNTPTAISPAPPFFGKRRLSTPRQSAV